MNAAAAAAAVWSCWLSTLGPQSMSAKHFSASAAGSLECRRRRQLRLRQRMPLPPSTRSTVRVSQQSYQRKTTHGTH